MRAALAATLCALALPALAKDTAGREAFDCGVMRACTVGEPCRDDDGTVVALVWLSDTEAEINYGGIGPYALTLDPELRTGAWRMGDITIQFVSTGDRGATLTVIPLRGEPERTQVQFLHCSPQ